jgi:DNA-binding transcriptional ArsR family regulator
MASVDEMADVFKALSDPTRLRLLKLLSSSPALCVNALARRLGVTQSAVSQHLRVLKQAHLVAGSRMGSFVHYSLKTDRLRTYQNWLAKHLGDKRP